MDIDASSLTRAMYGNARLDSFEKMASALGVSVKTLFEALDNDEIENYIKTKKRNYQFNSKEEINKILEK